MGRRVGFAHNQTEPKKGTEMAMSLADVRAIYERKPKPPKPQQPFALSKARATAAQTLSMIARRPAWRGLPR